MHVNSTLVMFETCRCTLGEGGADDMMYVIQCGVPEEAEGIQRGVAVSCN